MPSSESSSSKHSRAPWAGRTRTPNRSSRLVTANKLCPSSSTTSTLRPRSSPALSGATRISGGPLRSSGSGSTAAGSRRGR